MMTRKDEYSNSLRQTYRRLVGQLDQKVGREKQILRKYMRALNREIREGRQSLKTPSSGISHHGGTEDAENAQKQNPGQCSS